MNKAAAIAALLLAGCGSESAEPAIEVGDAWARATVAGQGSTAAYFTLRNGGGADQLIGVASSAGRASIHSTATDDGIARMRALDRLQVPARSTVELKPGGTHLMISGLTRPLEPGRSLVLELDFARSGSRRVAATVSPAGAEGAKS